MAGRLKGKTAFMTAAAAGIGRASAIAMTAEGARVIASDIDEAGLRTLTQEAPGITTHVMDALDAHAIQRAAERFGPVDILFNCTGWVHQGTILDCSEGDFEFSVDLNLKAHYRIIKAFLPEMIENGGGSIINMASAASSIKGAPNRCIYGATKAAVIGLTKSVAADFIAQGIRCNAICPGSVETPSLEQRMRSVGGDYDAVRKAFIDRAPMGRMASPREIANVVVYLASDETAFITGETHLIDGGWCL
jgi:2-keto-3-deoxy-L-fuconate dehydrogenase